MSRAAEHTLEKGIAAHRAGRLDAAGAAYDAVLRLAPKHPVAWSMKGTLALQLGRPDDAITCLSRAIELDDGEAGDHLNLGNALRRVGRLDEAVASYRRAIAIDPTRAESHTNLGNALRDQGDLVGATAAHRRALERAPRLFPAAANLAQLLVERAEIPRDEARAAVDRAIAIADALGLAGPDVANLHNARGNLVRKSSVSDAIASYRRAIEIDPRFAEAHFNLGRALATELDETSLEAAVTALESGLALQPRELSAYRDLALYLRRLRRNDDATRVYEAWHAADPSDPIPAHMARAGRGEAPERASDAYIQKEFDDFASAFDEVLVSQLGYRAPELVGQAIARAGLGTRSDLEVLDAGCGTGLAVTHLRPLARHLVGVDLSSKMLDKARARGGYDALVEAELGAFAQMHPSAFDLIVAADVLLYFGDLDGIVRALGAALVVDGTFVFTVEAGTDAARGWSLNDGGRYAHHPDYVRGVVERAGLEVRELVEDRLRFELGAEVRGWVVTAKRPG